MSRFTLLRLARVPVAGVMALAAVGAQATVDPSVTQSIIGVGADLATYGALMVGAGIAFFVVKTAGRKLGFWV